MSSRADKVDTGAGVSFIVSAVIHLAVFLLLVWWGEMFPVKFSVQETYYVDVVNLPVAEPQAASPTQATTETTSTAEPIRQAPTLPSTSRLKSPASSASKTAKSSLTPEPAESEAAFNDRMAKYERDAEAKREEEIFKRLQNKVKSAKNAAPGITDAEAGSRYIDYIKSRLEDSLKITSSYSSRKPEIAVRLTISVDGRLLQMKVEKSSGDATFELAVRRAIDLASEKFTPPPNKAVFENGFVFRPKGITTGISR